MKPNTPPTNKESADLPEPGKKKQNPKELDKLLDTALEDSMAASDPPAVTQPDVKKGGQKEGHDVGKDAGRYDSGKQVGNKI